MKKVFVLEVLITVESEQDMFLEGLDCDFQQELESLTPRVLVEKGYYDDNGDWIDDGNGEVSVVGKFSHSHIRKP
tara:strand:+ start:436 stop:660 length:225 start_codon:yes stop_codon:yes gene_type:complete